MGYGLRIEIQKILALIMLRLLRNFRLDFRRGLRRRRRFRIGHGPVIPPTKPGVVQSGYDIIQRRLKIAGRSQDVGHIQSGNLIAPRMRQTENASKNLLHVHAACTVGKRRKHIGERTVPALFQSVHRNDETDWTVRAHQIDAFQFVHVGGTNGDLVRRDSGLFQFFAESLKGRAVFFYSRLRLKQNDGADIASRRFALPFR